ncbi:phosphoribosyltransferase family protein [Bacillus badius]|uniref:phosphoribosyltransferase family protein n=1 Tax=Bacillus badius TaxID=1455 RepID=UPI0005ADAD0E|nr:phosphoribosyltransferase family protein [Bacillus badius]KIL76680.1 Adenine/guanine phosphoribosyltransferase [Bacillus badius]
MKTAHSSTYYPNRYTHNIGRFLKVDVQIDENPYNLPAKALYEMAARINKKRSFLFVSKVLGKHIPLHPSIPSIASALLASLYYERETGDQLPGKEQLIEALNGGSAEQLEAAYSLATNMTYSPEKPLLFIGFAETATALGHGVFDCFSQSTYIHSTREMLLDKEVTLYFEEEHSHATDQRCYAPEESLDNDRPVCLVDDEITTGKTALNIIASIQRKYPRKQYVVLSLLDWRTEQDRQRVKEFEREWGIEIHTHSLLSGSIQVHGAPAMEEGRISDKPSADKEPEYSRISLRSISPPIPSIAYSSIDSLGATNEAPYLAITGRFGLSSENKGAIEDYCRKIGEHLLMKRQGKRTLCLGTGEFMYIPMKAAAHMGEGVWYHSTTRSPIFPLNEDGYPVRSRLAFESPDDPAIMNYAYNVLDCAYDEVFIFFERPVDEKRLSALLREFRSLPHIHIVNFN